MADDDLTSELDRIAERHEHMRARYGNVGGLLALAGAKNDMPRLLAALRAVLELADEMMDTPWSDTGGDRANVAVEQIRFDGMHIREVITREITGKGASDD